MSAPKHPTLLFFTFTIIYQNKTTTRLHMCLLLRIDAPDSNTTSVFRLHLLTGGLIQAGFLSDRIVHNSKLNSRPVPSPFFVTFVLFLLNSNPLSLRHPSNDTLLEHQAIMLPNLPHKHCLSKPMPLHAFLSFLLWPYVLAIVLALFFEVLRLFVCSRDSIPVVFQAAIWCLQRETTIMKYIFKNRVVLTS